MKTPSKKLAVREKMDKVIETFYDYCFCSGWSFNHICPQIMNKYGINKRFASAAFTAAKAIRDGSPSDRALNEAMDKLGG